MSHSLYQLSVPLFINGLKNLLTVLQKARAYCASREVEESILINDRLHNTMLPLAAQVNMAVGQATRTMDRILGKPERADLPVSTNFDEAVAIVEQAIAELQGIDQSSIVEQANKEISFTVATYHLNFPGAYIYLQNFVIPNFYFHTTTAYNILRHNGVDLSKGDFLGETGGTITMLEE